MKNVVLLIIGNEILEGLRKDKNFAIAKEKLKDVARLVALLFVGDDIVSLKRALKFSKSIGDIIITSGGLGLTPDDITLLAASKAFNIPLKKTEKKKKVVLKNLSKFDEGFYSKYIEELSLGLKGAVPLENPKGVVAGERMDIGGKVFYILPGVPSEFEAMLDIVIQQLKPTKEFQQEASYNVFEKEVNLIRVLRNVEKKFKVQTASYPPIEAGETLKIILKSKLNTSFKESITYFENYLKKHKIKFYKLID